MSEDELKIRIKIKEKEKISFLGKKWEWSLSDAPGNNIILSELIAIDYSYSWYLHGSAYTKAGALKKAKNWAKWYCQRYRQEKERLARLYRIEREATYTEFTCNNEN